MVLPKGLPSYSARDEAYACTAACQQSRRVRATVPWSSVVVHWRWSSCATVRSHSPYARARPSLQALLRTPSGLLGFAVTERSSSLVIPGGILVLGHGRWSSTAPATSCSPPLPSGGELMRLAALYGQAFVFGALLRHSWSPLDAFGLRHRARECALVRGRTPGLARLVCVRPAVLLVQRPTQASSRADCCYSWRGVIFRRGAPSSVGHPSLCVSSQLCGLILRGMYFSHLNGEGRLTICRAALAALAFAPSRSYSPTHSMSRAAPPPSVAPCAGLHGLLRLGLGSGGGSG